MSQRDMSNRNLRPDRMKGDKESFTSSAQREKEAVRPPLAGRGRGGGTRLHRVDAAGGSTSQTGPSQMVDPTPYQHHHDEEYNSIIRRRRISLNIRRGINLSIRWGISLSMSSLLSSRLSLIWRMG
jgi:hypothetical protein